MMKNLTPLKFIAFLSFLIGSVAFGTDGELRCRTQQTVSDANPELVLTLPAFTDLATAAYTKLMTGSYLETHIDIPKASIEITYTNNNNQPVRVPLGTVHFSLTDDLHESEDDIPLHKSVCNQELPTGSSYDHFQIHNKNFEITGQKIENAKADLQGIQHSSELISFVEERMDYFKKRESILVDLKDQQKAFKKRKVKLESGTATDDTISKYQTDYANFKTAKSNFKNAYASKYIQNNIVVANEPFIDIDGETKHRNDALTSIVKWGKTGPFKVSSAWVTSHTSEDYQSFCDKYFIVDEQKLSIDKSYYPNLNISDDEKKIIKHDEMMNKLVNGSKNDLVNADRALYCDIYLKN